MVSPTTRNWDTPLDRLWQPLILTVAPNGAYKTKRDHPGVPLTAQEIAATAKACLDAGAAMLHLHVRDSEGRHLLDAHAYREATAAVRKAVGERLVIQITTEAAKRYAPEQQMAVAREVKPEAVSVALREIIPDAEAETRGAEFFAWLHQEKIMPQIILYSPEDLRRYLELRERGVLPQGKDFLLFVLGRYSAGQTSEPADLLPFLAAHDGTTPWSLCAFGPKENACVLSAAALGGHARVGFENNLLLPGGETAPDNAALVRLAVRGAALIGRPLADADAVRRLFA